MSIFRSRRPVLTVLLTILFTTAAGAIGLFLLSLTAERPTNLGVANGRLASCPSSPNCVSTQAEDRDHWIAPIPVTSEVLPPIEVLADIVRSLPRTTIVEQSNHYLRALAYCLQARCSRRSFRHGRESQPHGNDPTTLHRSHHIPGTVCRRCRE